VRITFAEPTLEALDDLGGQCLVVTFFSDDRPLRGLAGRVDWRLNGLLSRLILAGFLDGHPCEALLAPIAGRLPQEKMLLVGMGRRGDFSARRFAEVCTFCFRTLVKLQVSDFAMGLPGRVGLDVGLRDALGGWRRALTDGFSPESRAAVRIALLEGAEVQSELVEPMRDLERMAPDSLQSPGLGALIVPRLAGDR
jgi:hypothetical protein